MLASDMLNEQQPPLSHVPVRRLSMPATDRVHPYQVYSHRRHHYAVELNRQQHNSLLNTPRLLDEPGSDGTERLRDLVFAALEMPQARNVSETSLAGSTATSTSSIAPTLSNRVDQQQQQHPQQQPQHRPIQPRRPGSPPMLPAMIMPRVAPSQLASIRPLLPGPGMGHALRPQLDAPGPALPPKKRSPKPKKFSDDEESDEEDEQVLAELQNAYSQHIAAYKEMRSTVPVERDANGDKLRRYDCLIPGCVKFYRNQNGLKYHLHKYHSKEEAKLHKQLYRIVKNDPDEKRFGCPYCIRRYRNGNGLSYHLQHVHSIDLATAKQLTLTRRQSNAASLTNNNNAGMSVAIDGSPKQ